MSRLIDLSIVRLQWSILKGLESNRDIIIPSFESI
jgi:hypothetical protein